MSDYTAPNKSVGQSWTADEHNDLKDAVNSKMDKANLKNDLTAPLTTTFPSTILLSQIVAREMTYRGDINGMSNIDLCVTPGYYTSTSPGGGDWHASFPETVPEEICKVGLLVYSIQAFVNQELTLYLERPRVFKRVFRDSSFSEWVEYMTISAAAEEFAPVKKSGTPTVSMVSAPPGFSISISANSRDLGGIITITNTAANPQPNVEFSLAFQYTQPTMLSVALTAGNDTAMEGKKQVVSITAGGFNGKVSGNIPVGGSSVIYYGIFLNS